MHAAFESQSVPVHTGDFTLTSFQCCVSCADAAPLLRQRWVNFCGSRCVGFGATTAHVFPTLGS